MNEIEAAAQKLRTAIRLLHRRAWAVSGRNGPTRSEQGVMAWLDEKGALTPGTLADAEKVRPQTMGQTLEALDRRRWILRRPHPDDRRQVLITLSAAGRKALYQNRKRRQAWLVGELRQLAPRELRTVIEAADILDRIAQSPAGA
jgi:DNA-binding MarR family transcriptional regulator